MKNITKLILISAMVASTASQAATIGAAVAGGLWYQYSGGGVGSNYAYVAGDETTTTEPLPPHNYQAEASFNIGELTPVLRAEAYSDDLSAYQDPYIAAGAYGLQTYQNTSGITQTYTLNLDLHGSVLKSPGSSYINAEVGIFTGTDLFADYTSCSGASEYLAGFDSYTCGAQIGTGFTPYIEMATDGDGQIINDTASFSVGAGGTFTIYAELEALTFGGYADSFSTLSMTFDDTTNLAALGEMVVPVPAAIWLFGSGLVGLIGISRRKTRILASTEIEA